jgi:hypothetical protein
VTLHTIPAAVLRDAADRAAAAQTADPDNLWLHIPDPLVDAGLRRLEAGERLTVGWWKRAMNQPVTAVEPGRPWQYTAWQPEDLYRLADDLSDPHSLLCDEDKVELLASCAADHKLGPRELAVALGRMRAARGKAA